ncbi:MAG: hypothetical protein ACFFD1_12630, partial [Candidatus Thorarchaeota archaeon]
PFRLFLTILGFIGIIVHELSHYVLCKLLGVPVEQIHIQYRDKMTGKAAPRGSILPKEPERISFLQALIIGFAPLFISTWLILFCFDIFSIIGLDIYLYFIAGFMIVSLLIGGAPSPADMRYCYYGFVRSPAYSLYQVLLISISILTVIFFINYSWVLLPFEFMYYILQYLTIAGLYFVYKYFFRFVNQFIAKNRHSEGYKDKLLTRKRHRPINPQKIGIEEPHW